MSTYLPLGTRVHAADTLVRTTHEVTSTTDRRAWVRKADRWPGLSVSAPAPVDGIVVGVRHLSNGTLEWAADYSPTYVRRDGVTAYLIAHHLHRRPVLALVEDVEEVRG